LFAKQGGMSNKLMCDAICCSSYLISLYLGKFDLEHFRLDSARGSGLGLC